ncbi:hypothetical protein WN55_10554 [Dufourea novaeangliae]|uniref:Uncharacterized protein n=1 Tax=Dufourea novaeangliae TaxID=178035 RepID=A0A154P474_DUFNO|nr:hypothetical protein WN55_10554 [Dufourea novaeangliae]
MACLKYVGFGPRLGTFCLAETKRIFRDAARPQGRQPFAADRSWNWFAIPVHAEGYTNNAFKIPGFGTPWDV